MGEVGQVWSAHQFIQGRCPWTFSFSARFSNCIIVVKITKSSFYSAPFATLCGSAGWFCRNAALRRHIHSCFILTPCQLHGIHIQNKKVQTFPFDSNSSLKLATKSACIALLLRQFWLASFTKLMWTDCTFPVAAGLVSECSSRPERLENLLSDGPPGDRHRKEGGGRRGRGKRGKGEQQKAGQGPEACSAQGGAESGRGWGALVWVMRICGCVCFVTGWYG